MEDRIEPDAFRESFADKAERLSEKATYSAIQKVKKGFTMQKADKVWVAAAIVIPLVLRDRRQRHKIKDLRKSCQLLNIENQFWNAFVNGLLDPKANREQLFKDLSTNFKSIAHLKGE